MELNEEFNNKYKEDKRKYERFIISAKEFLEQRERHLILVRRREDVEIELKRAKEDGDKDKIEQVNEKLSEEKERENEIKKEIKRVKDTIEESKSKVDSYIEELKKDPEVEKKVNEILEKRYSRQLNKHITESNQLDTIIRLCKETPLLNNNLKGIVRYQETFEKLSEELNGLDPIVDIDKVEDLREKMKEVQDKKTDRLNDFISISAKKNENVSREFLEKLVKENKFAHDKNGNIKLDKTLTNISKGYQKRILTYKKSIEKIQNVKSDKRNVQEVGEVDSDITENDYKTTALMPVENLRWWQVMKKVKAWIQSKKDKVNNPDTDNIDTDNIDTKSSVDKFRDLYKYDIVKDYVNAQEKNIFRETGKEVRREKKDNIIEEDNDLER